MIGIFGRPLALLLILATIPATLIYAFRFRRLKTALLPLVSRTDDTAVTALTRMILVRAVCFCAAWVFLVCAAAAPQWGSELVPTRREGSSVFFVIDVSRSMTVDDVSPSRLAFAAGYASMLAERMEKARCGVVLVKGSGSLAIPLTADRRSLEALFKTLSPSMLSAPGSALAHGVGIALESFPENSAASRTIILLTDGDETIGSLGEAARKIRMSGTRLVIVGVGTKPGRELSVNPSQDAAPLRLMTLRDDLLRTAVKDAGNGSFYVNGTDVGSAQRVLSAVLPDSIGERSLVYSSRPVPCYSFFLLAALVFFCAGCVAGGVTWRKE